MLASLLLAVTIQIPVGHGGVSFQDALKEVYKVRTTNTTDDIEILLEPKGYGFRRAIYIDNTMASAKGGRLIIRPSGKTLTGVKPIFYGSLPVKGWKRVAKPMNGRSDVYVADVSAFEFSNQVTGLFLNGRKMRLARYPNFDPKDPYAGGWAFVPGKWISMYDFPGGENRTDVKVGDKDWHNWSVPTEGIMTIFPRQRYGSSRVPIAALDAEKKIIKTAKNMCDVARPGDTYFVAGFREELDAPGEWFHDLKAQKLYFIPPKGTDMMKAKITIPTMTRVFNLKGASNVTFEDVEFCAADQSVLVEGGSDVAFIGCKFHDFVGTALDLYGASKHRIQDCDFYDVGGSAIHMTGGSQENPNDTVVENCHIYNVADETYCSSAIFMEGWGFHIRHNLLHDLPHWGVFHTGGMHELTDNRVHHYMLETEDGAAFYTCNELGNHLTTIARNWISDGIGFAKCAGYGPLSFYQNCHGFYFDSGPGDGFIYDNVMERVSGMCLKMDSNHNQLVSNNVFTACGRPELLHWSYNMNLSGKEAANNKLIHNVWDYPDCPSSIYVLIQGADITKNTFDYNLINSGSKTPHIQKMEWKKGWQEKLGADKNSLLVSTINFKDSAKGDFTLKNETPAKELGIHPVNVSKAGLYVTKHRPKITKCREGAAEHPEWFVGPDYGDPEKEKVREKQIKAAKAKAKKSY